MKIATFEVSDHTNVKIKQRFKKFRLESVSSEVDVALFPIVTQSAVRNPQPAFSRNLI
jgi:hypothetical protein